MADKTLDQSRYMQALGLFTMARLHADRANSFRDELLAHLGASDLGNVEDAVWTEGSGPKEFDDALQKEGFVVEPQSR